MTITPGYRLKAFLVIWIVSLGAVTQLSAQISFSDLDLADPDTLLFRANVRAPRFETYSVAIEARLASGDIAPLTLFPEEIEWLPAREAVQIRNRFGTVHLDPDTAEVTPVTFLDSFAGGDAVQTGTLPPVSYSPDGRYMVVERPRSPGYARLVLVDTSDGSEVTVSERVARRGQGPVARFSPDGRTFVYSREGNVYLFPIDRYRNDRMLSEEFRRIGRGNLRHVRWTDGNHLYVVQGRLVYRLDYSGLFARSIYRDIVRSGEVVGRIPVAFDGSFDEFWVAPDSDFILVNRGGRNLFLGELGAVSSARSLPFLSLPAGSSVEQVVWSRDGIITVLLREHKDGHVSIRRITLSDAPEDIEFETVSQDETIRSFQRSPDGRLIAVVTEDTVDIRRYNSWNLVHAIENQHETNEFIAARWIDDRNLFIADNALLSRFELETEELNPLAFSQANRAGFDGDADEAVTLNQNNRSARVEYRETGEGDAERGWPPYRLEFRDDAATLRDPSTAGANYRVFVDALSSSAYRNRIMVRDLEALSTSALFEPPQRDFDPFPEREEEIDFRNFDHGSRVRAREVAVTVDAVAADVGLADVLASFDRYGFEATFFVSGDFLRRNADSAPAIARSGHEAGNLFSSHIDLTDASLGISDQFIQEGLANNEDRYFDITGEELKPLWHAPYYLVTEELLAAAEQAGYRHVGRDIETLDAVPRFTADGQEPRYRPTADIIERIVERVKPGSIINVSLGIPGEDDVFGGRDDYLYHRLDVLFQELDARGYTVVPVSRLIERAQEGVQ